MILKIHLVQHASEYNNTKILNKIEKEIQMN